MTDFYSKLTDADLIALLREDDRHAFTEIYERYHSLLYIYANKKLHDKIESQDVVQDTLITLWHKRKDFSPNVSLAAYLYAMVRNRAFDLFSRKKVEDKYLGSLQGLIMSSTPTDFLVREKDIQTLIDKEIDALPPRMRKIFTLSRKNLLTNKEIAAMLDLSPHTVDTQIKRALKVLRLRLGMIAWLLIMVCY